MARKSRAEYFQLSPDDKQVIKKLEILTQAVERVYPSTKWLLWRSFLHGLFVALGGTLGFALIISAITLLIAQLRLIPPLNAFIEQTKIEKVLPER